MDKEIELTERQRKILTAYRDLSRDGTPPSYLAIANRVGVEGSNDNSRQANVSTVVRRLRQLGLVPALNASKPATGTKQPPRSPRNGLEDLKAPPRKTNGHAAPPAKPSRTTSSDPFILDLIAKRDDFRRNAEALDNAIEAMSVAL